MRGIILRKIVLFGSAFRKEEFGTNLIEADEFGVESGPIKGLG